MFYGPIEVFLTATLKFVLLLKCWSTAKDTSEGTYSISQKQSNPHYVDECRFEKVNILIREGQEEREEVRRRGRKGGSRDERRTHRNVPTWFILHIWVLLHIY